MGTVRATSKRFISITATHARIYGKMPAANGIPRTPDERADRKRPQRVDPLTQIPPHDLDAERGVLASILFAPWHLDAISTVLRPDDFYDEANRAIYEAMLSVHATGRRMEDPKVLADRLKQTGQLERVGGIAALMEIAEGTAHGGNAEYYASVVRDLAVRRDALYLAYKTYQRANEPGVETRDILIALESGLSDLHAARSLDRLHVAGDVAGASMHRVLFSKRKPKVGIKTGLATLDSMTNGYCRGHYITIAARTSVGKSALATSHVAYWWRNTDAVGLFCTMEMSEGEVMDRVLCNMATLDTYRFAHHLLDADEQARLKEAVHFMQSHKRLYIDDTPRRTMTEILSQARRTQRMAGKLDYVIVDYLQLLDSPLKYAKRHEQIADITRQIKIAAKEMDVPFIVLAQLNRQADGERPRLSHLRESGSIEQDSDVVIFIHRKVDEDGNGGAESELIVAKNRNGRVGTAKAAFLGNFQRFDTMYEETF